MEFAAPTIGKFLNNSFPRILNKSNAEPQGEAEAKGDDDFLKDLSQLLNNSDMIFEPSETVYKTITADIEEAPSTRPGNEFPLILPT